MDYQGLTIRFAGDASQLLAAMREIDSNTDRTMSNLQRINTALKLDPNNPKLYTTQAKLMNVALGEQGDKLRDLKTKQQEYAQKLERARAMMERYRDAGKENTYEYKALEDACGKYEQALETLDAKIQATSAEMEKMGESYRLALGQEFLHNDPFGQSILELKSAGEDLVYVGDKLATAGAKITAAEAALGLTFGRQVVTEAEQYGNAISQVGGYLDISGSKLDEMSDLALYWGKETQFSATEAANAMSELAKGGMTDAQIQAGALEATMQLAAAGGISMADAATVAVNAIKVFGLDAGDATEVADALAGAANKSTAEIGGLASAFRYVSGWAGLADYSVNDVSGALGLLADHGLQAEMAGTGLRNFMQRLGAPTGKAKELLDQYGVSVYDTSGKMKSLTDLVDELNDAFGDLDDETRNETLNTIFGARALPAAIALMDAGSDELERYIDATKRAGYAEEMMQARMGDLGWALEYLRGEYETFQVNIGKAMEPQIIKVANAIEDMLSEFNSWSNARQAEFVTNMLKLAAVGPSLLVVGNALKVMGHATSGVARLSIFMSQFGISLGKNIGTTNAFGEAVVAASDGAVTASRAVSLLKTSVALLGVAAVAFIGYALWREFEKDRKRAESLNRIMEGTNKLLGDSGPKADTLAESLYDVGDAAKGTARDVDELLTNLSDFYDKVDETLSDVEVDDSRLNRAWEIISRLGGRDDLDDTELRELAGALGYINDELDTNYGLHSDTSGIIYDENDNVVNLTTSIWKLIEAQKAQRKAEAYGDILKDAYKQQADAMATAEAEKKKFDEMMAKANDPSQSADYRNFWHNLAMEQYEDWQTAEEAVDQATAAVERLDEQYGEAELEAQKAAESTQNALAENKDAIDGLSEALEEQGISVSDFVGLTNDEFKRMLDESGGDIDALIALLQEWKEQQPAAAEGGVEGAEESQQEINDVREAADELDGTGATVEVSASTDKAKDEFDAYYNDISSTKIPIEAETTVDKDPIYQFMLWLSGLFSNSDTDVEVNATGNITDGTARRAVVDYNHSRLSKHTGMAMISGNIWDFMRKILPGWKQAKLDPKTGSANVSGNLHQSTNDLKEWNRLGMDSKWGKATIALAIQSKGIKQRDGGINYYRHADGYITNHSIYSTGHLIGEAGIEAVLPLNNRAATRPLTDTIADGVARRVAGATQYNLYINDARVNDDPAIRSAFIGLMTTLERKGAMNVGNR